MTLSPHPPAAGLYNFALLQRFDEAVKDGIAPESLCSVLAKVLGARVVVLLARTGKRFPYRVVGHHGRRPPSQFRANSWVKEAVHAGTAPVTSSAEYPSLGWLGKWIMAVGLPENSNILALCGRNSLFLGYDVQMGEIMMRTAYSPQQAPGNIAQTLMNSRERLVTIFGKDTGKWSNRLRAIQRNLERVGLNAVLIRDIPDQRQQTLEEKAMFWALSSRFVILEDSVPTGHLVELKDLQLNRITTIVMRQKGYASTFMSAALAMDFRFIREVLYTPGGLRRAVEDSVRWANRFVESRACRLDKEYKRRR